MAVSGEMLELLDLPVVRRSRPPLAFRQSASAGLAAFLLASVIVGFAGLSGLSVETNRVDGDSVQLLSANQLPADVLLCVKACVHVNLIRASSRSIGVLTPHTSCASCSGLASSAHVVMGKPDSGLLRMIDEMWKSVHHQELCAAVADDPELYKQCTTGNTWGKTSTGNFMQGNDQSSRLMDHWALGSSALRNCIAGAVDLDQAQLCLKSKDDTDIALSPSGALSPLHDGGDSRDDADVDLGGDGSEPDGVEVPANVNHVRADPDTLRHCRGLRTVPRLMTDCVNLEMGMKNAMKPLVEKDWPVGGHDLESRKRLRHEQPRKPFENIDSSAESRGMNFPHMGTDGGEPVTGAQHKIARSNDRALSRNDAAENPVRSSRFPLASSNIPSAHYSGINSADTSNISENVVMRAVDSLTRTVNALESEVEMKVKKEQTPAVSVAPVINVSPVFSFNFTTFRGRMPRGGLQPQSEGDRHDAKTMQHGGSYDDAEKQRYAAPEAHRYVSEIDKHRVTYPQIRPRESTNSVPASIHQTVAGSCSPTISPDGGQFSTPVTVQISVPRSDMQIRYTIDGTAPSLDSQIYGEAFVLPSGSNNTVKAIAVLGDVMSNVSAANFVVLPCALSARCCRLQVILQRFITLRSSLLRRNASSVSEIAQQRATFERETDAWLSAEVGYDEAVAQGKEEKEAAQYAFKLSRVWEQATKVALARYKGIVAQNKRERVQLQSERALILEVMGMIDELHSRKHETGANAAKRILHIQSKLRNLGKNNGLTSLTSSLPSYRESSEVKTILESMLHELDLRAQLLTNIERKSLEVLHQDQAKMLNWQQKSVHLAAMTHRSQLHAAEEDLQRQMLGGSVKANHEGQGIEQDLGEGSQASYERELEALQAIIQTTQEAFQNCSTS